jgi:cytochrome c-type biogenesis protein
MTSLNEFPLIASFLAGIVTFISPCILPLIPVYISFITGTSIEQMRAGATHPRHAFRNSLFFVLGFTAIFVLLGASASYLGNLLNQEKDYIRWIGGIIVIVFGLHIAGVIRIPLFYHEKHLALRNVHGFLKPFLVGLAFAVGWTPCVGPILSSILILASAQETVYRGMLLLTVYSLGLGIPFIITALFIHWALGVFSRIQRYYRFIEIAAGAVLVVLGIMLLTNRFQMVTGYASGLFE